MSAPYGLRFGPVALAVEGPPPHPLLEPWRGEVAPDARRVRVSVVASLAADAGPATVAAGFALTPHDDHDELAVVEGERHAPWLAAVCEVVARESPPKRALLLHAGGVTVEGGVALLVAPPGVGKTTAVRAAGPRAFASNAVMVALEGGAPTVWAMPFNRDAAPELESPRALPLAAFAFVHRSDEPRVEWMASPLATMRLMSHVTRPRGDDPHARARTALALSLGAAARALTLGLPRGPGYLAALDAALHPMTSPP